MLSVLANHLGSLLNPIIARCPSLTPTAEYRRGVPVRPNVFVLCMHKAGSTFVADVLLPSIALRTAEYDLFNIGSTIIKYKQQYLQQHGRPPDWAGEKPTRQVAFYLAEHKLPSSNQLHGRLYPRNFYKVADAMGCPIPNRENHLIVMRRDPRDALVSLYYSRAISHDPNGILGDKDFFRQQRERLQAKSIRAGLKHMIRSGIAKGVLNEFLISTHLLRNRGACDLPYELLIREPRDWLTKFVAAGELQRYVDDAWYDEMVAHLQPPDVADPTKHKRRMTPGNWIEVFDAELCAMVKRRVGKRMAQFGYTWESPSQYSRAA